MLDVAASIILGCHPGNHHVVPVHVLCCNVFWRSRNVKNSDVASHCIPAILVGCHQLVCSSVFPPALLDLDSASVILIHKNETGTFHNILPSTGPGLLRRWLTIHRDVQNERLSSKDLDIHHSIPINPWA